MRRFAWLLLVVALCLAGCGGDTTSRSGERTTTYFDPTEGWDSNDQAPPGQCLTLVASGVRVCNTDPGIVYSTQLILTGASTLAESVSASATACINAGLDPSACNLDAGSIGTLIAYNITHGLP